MLLGALHLKNTAAEQKDHVALLFLCNAHCENIIEGWKA